MKITGLPVPAEFQRKHPTLGIIIGILGVPFVLFLQAILLRWGWNAVIAESSSVVDGINIWQAALFIATYKLCLRRSNPRTTKAQKVVDKPKGPKIEEVVPSVQ